MGLIITRVEKEGPLARTSLATPYRFIVVGPGVGEAVASRVAERYDCRLENVVANGARFLVFVSDETLALWGSAGVLANGVLWEVLRDFDVACPYGSSLVAGGSRRRQEMSAEVKQSLALTNLRAAKPEDRRSDEDPS